MELKKKKYNIFDAISIPIRCSPISAISIILIRIIDGLIPLLLIDGTAGVVDVVKKVLRGQADRGNIVMPVIFLASIIAYPWISNRIINYPLVKLENNIRLKYKSCVIDKIAALKYKHIESQDTWDLILRINKEPEKRLRENFNNVLKALGLVIVIISVIVKVVIYVWWAPIVVVICAIPIILISKNSGKEQYEAEREISKSERKYNYFSEILKSRESIEEKTMFQYGTRVNKEFYDAYDGCTKLNARVYGKFFFKMIMSGVIVTIISIILAMILSIPVIKGEMSIGIFMGTVNGVFSLIQALAWGIGGAIGNIVKANEYMKDLSKYIDLEEENDVLCMPSPETVPFQSLEFRNVTFKYPATEKVILNNLSFKIEEGKHYALVGTNGCGKTTITKLMTGLYDEHTGEILINNKNIREFSQGELKRMNSIVYQDFAKYYVSFKDNIALGDITNINSKGQDEKIAEAIKLMNLDGAVNELPKGIENTLGKIKDDGMDLSGGQWQRLAMARTIISNPGIRILDEPTAALDPISESKIYEDFKKISKENTTIFISHRLGSTKLANEIFVLDDGQVKEKGSFEELMKLNGIYANMFESQRSWYVNE